MPLIALAIRDIERPSVQALGAINKIQLKLTTHKLTIPDQQLHPSQILRRFGKM